MRKSVSTINEHYVLKLKMFKPAFTEGEYKKILKEAWSNNLIIEDAFPSEIATWINQKAALGGVPASYIAWPLLVTAAHCSQHSFVEIPNILMKEPLLLYGLVVGRSGKNLLYKL